MNDKQRIEKLLRSLPETVADIALGTLDWRDISALCDAQAMFHVNNRVNIADTIVSITRVI